MSETSSDNMAKIHFNLVTETQVSWNRFLMTLLHNSWAEFLIFLKHYTYSMISRDPQRSVLVDHGPKCIKAISATSISNTPGESPNMMSFVCLSVSWFDNLISECKKQRTKPTCLTRNRLTGIKTSLCLQVAPHCKQLFLSSKHLSQVTLCGTDATTWGTLISFIRMHRNGIQIWTCCCRSEGERNTEASPVLLQKAFGQLWNYFLELPGVHMQCYLH